MAFILGLIIGPAVGLFAGLYFGTRGAAFWRGVVALVFFLIFVLFAPFFDLELKIGILLSTPLGLLLAATPIGSRSPHEVEYP